MRRPLPTESQPCRPYRGQLCREPEADRAGNTSVTDSGLANRLTAIAGDNTLHGSWWNDDFIFNSTLGVGNTYRIFDFDVVEDSIALENAVFVGLAMGTLLVATLVADSTGFAATASDRIIYETDNGRLFFDIDGVGEGKRIQFAALTAGLAVTSTDFFVF